jgi:hypothetical protein
MESIQYRASATSGSEPMRCSACCEGGESTSTCVNASLPRCFLEQYRDAMLIPSSAMIFATSAIMPGRSR